LSVQLAGQVSRIEELERGRVTTTV
jgi:hypothetical protein